MRPVRKQLREASGQGRWLGFSDPVRRFMADYEASTAPYTKDDARAISGTGTRLHANGVTSVARPQMDPMEGNREEISVAWLHSHQPNKGLGSEALRHLTGLADRHGVTMTLEPSRPPFLAAHGGPDDDGLERWYSKHGFRMGEYGVMTRHPRRVRESIADALIATRLYEGDVVRASFGDRHSWRKPSETLTANQLSDADVTTWMPDSHHVADRNGGSSSSTATFNTRSKRGKVKSTPLLQIKRTATGDGTYRESSTSHPILQRADRHQFGNTSNVHVTPHSDEFEVELSRGVLDRTFHDPWSKLFDKYGHNEVFNNYRDATGATVSRKLTNDDMKDAVYLRYDNPHAAIHMARTFGGEPGLDVTVRHNRHFSKNGSPPDYNWPESVGTIDYAHDPTPDGKVKYKRSFHALLDHAKATGRPHRCTDVKGVPGPARCTGQHPCPAARAAFGTQIGESMADTLEKKYGITHREKRTPTSSVCSIGYSERKKKFFGWSHRAIAGFGVGDGFFPEPPDGPEAVHWDPPEEKDRVKIKTMEQAKRSAKNFAKWVA